MCVCVYVCECVCVCMCVYVGMCVHSVHVTMGDHTHGTMGDHTHGTMGDHTHGTMGDHTHGTMDDDIYGMFFSHTDNTIVYCYGNCMARHVYCHYLNMSPWLFYLKIICTPIHPHLGSLVERNRPDLLALCLLTTPDQ